MSLSLAQRRALAIVPKCTGVMSMIGSSFVITDVVRDKKKMSQTYSRLVLGFSCVDFMVSFAMFLSTWPIPSDSPGVLGASGTIGSCNYQGFFIQFNITVSWYNLCLAIYYLLVITFKWSDLRVKRIEKWMHIGPLAFGLGTSISSIPLTLYNNSNFWCWISSLPSECGNARGATGTCTRGDHAWIYRWAFFYGPLWFIIFAVSVAMATVSYSVWAGEKASRQYRNHGSTQRENKLSSLSRQVAIQSLCYVLAFYLTWTFPTILRLMQTVGAGVSFGISLMFVIFTPLQGFMNACVYIRPRYVRFRKLHPNDSCGKIMLEAIKMTYPCIGPCTRPIRRLLRLTKKRKPSTHHGGGVDTSDAAFSEENMQREDSGYDLDGDDYNSIEDAEVLNPAYQLQKSENRLEVLATRVTETNMSSREFDGGLSPEVPVRERFSRSSFLSMSRLSKDSESSSRPNLDRHQSTPAFPRNWDGTNPNWAKKVVFDLDGLAEEDAENDDDDDDDDAAQVSEEMNPQDDAQMQVDGSSDTSQHEEEQHGGSTRRGRLAQMVVQSVRNVQHMVHHNEDTTRNHPARASNGHGNPMPDDTEPDASP